MELHINVFVPALPVSSCLDVLQRTIGIGANRETFEFPDNVRVKLGKPLGFSSVFRASDVFGFRASDIFGFRASDVFGFRGGELGETVKSATIDCL